MVKVTNLTCEYLVNPLGLATMEPRFSWHIETDIQNAVQEKYQIIVTSEDGAVVWDSGQISSDQTVFVEYGGKPFQYCTKYFWCVRSLVNGSLSDYSPKAFFETPLEKWTAPFICADDKPEESGARTFKREITIDKPIKNARLYATALGLYELFIDGKAVTDTCFNPGWTAYGHRILYQTYDITAALENGKNELKAYVGCGWYKGELGWQGVRNLYGNKMALSLQIDITYTDGERETITTDTSWQYTDGPIIYSELYHGEVYDANKENSGPLHTANIYTDNIPKIEPHNGVAVKRHELFEPIAFFTTPRGERVLDFGQNLSGRVRFSVQGSSGDKVVLRHAEVLDSDGNFYTDNLRKAKCTDTYILKGGGIETYEPFFTFHGFRYVCIDQYPTDIDPKNFRAVAIYSDMEQTGSFSCSDKLINQLQSNISWSLKGNFLDIPTDCPQRDERLGWTGDAQVFIHAASYLYGVAPFFRKWLTDLALEQRNDGGVPFVIPDILRNLLKPDHVNTTGASHSSCGWGDAAVIIPWALYTYFGDKRLLQTQYTSMKAWVDYISSQANNHIWDSGFHFADWVALDAEEGSYYGATPNDLCATAFYAHCAQIMHKTADTLGKTEDTEKYKNLSENIVQAYQKKYFAPNGQLTARTQTAHILSLVFDLTPETLVEQTTRGLINLMEHHGGHMVTGFLGTPYICHALSKNSRLKEAYTLLQREHYPSWLFQIKMGATTIWEHLDGIKADGTMWDTNMNSFNHYAYGAVGDWLYQVVAGITPLQPGYKHISIAPSPGGNLTWAKGDLKTPYGPLSSNWTLDGDRFKLMVKIPPNTKAQIQMPNGDKHHVGSGEYIFDAILN